MTTWNFLTNHGRALLCIAHDPDVRIRDIAASLGITERRAHGIVTDLTDGGLSDQDERRQAESLRDSVTPPDPRADGP